MKTVFRPFWSYDLPKTEAWLTDMASRGWLPEEWNLSFRRFTFRQDTPVQRTYQISYAASSVPTMSSYLAAAGWRRQLQHGKWSLYENDQPQPQIHAFPSRKDVIRRNRKISYIFSGILLYLLLIALIPLIALGFSLSQDTPIQVQKSPMWGVTWAAAALAIVLLVLSLYSVMKLRRAGSALLTDLGDSGRPYGQQQRHAGVKMIRLKLGWMYAPDRLEQWLEDKERLGWNLYKVARWGTLFWFSKGRPRRMNYHADYQVIADEGYFGQHLEAGWNKVYSSPSSLQKWTIWSREYPEGTTVYQEMYSDPYHRLKHARKIAISYTLLFMPMLLLYSINLTAFVDGMLKGGITSSRAWHSSLMFISILLFGSFAARTWLYYRRLKRL